jgi:hypothetical protein
MHRNHALICSAEAALNEVPVNPSIAANAEPSVAVDFFFDRTILQP